MESGSRRLRQRLQQASAALRALVLGGGPDVTSAPFPGETGRRQHVRAAETRLLYENANTGISVSLIIAALVAYVLQPVVPGGVLGAWLLYMALVSAARFLVARRYWRALPDAENHVRWHWTFVAGAALAALGWAAVMVFYPDASPRHQTFLVFVVGGVMLGGASLLAATPAAFLAFLLPSGLLTSLALAAVGDRDHMVMGLLGVLFTVATVTTTWRFHRMIDSSFNLRFENHALIESLQTAKHDTEAINRELELRVTDRTARLVEADQRKDEFLATLAHELRNPLAPIRFALENLKADASPAAATRAREVVDRQVRHLVRLVDDLLDVSRITANKIHLRRESHELARLMSTAVESVAPLALAAEQELEVTLPPEPVRVEGDGARLIQIFANVLNNAVKFTPRGGHIWFTAEQQPGEIVLRVRDTGIGIEPAMLPRVFDMFQQAVPVLDRSVGGLGIGLTLARRLVEMHGGHIAISSAGSGQGTEVEIRLPVTPVAAPAVTGEPAALAASRTLRVLIVEDNVDAAEMLGLLVSKMGHVTRVVHDGVAAVAAAAEFLPDVVLMDVGLPLMNGYAVVRTLRQQPAFARVHFAAVTGWGQDEDRRKAREAGFDSHFTKPLAPATLQELLATIASRLAAGEPVVSTPRTRLSDAGSTSPSWR